MFNTVLCALKGHGIRAQGNALGSQTGTAIQSPERAGYEQHLADNRPFQGGGQCGSVPQGGALGFNTEPLRGKKPS